MNGDVIVGTISASLAVVAVLISWAQLRRTPRQVLPKKDKNKQPGQKVSTALEPAPERQLSGRGRIFHAPIGRLPKHVRGQERLTTHLSHLVGHPDGKCHVLGGLGGIGKSTTALRVAELTMARGAQVWWVSGVDKRTLTASLLTLAEKLGAEPSLVEAAFAGRVDPSDVLWDELNSRADWLLIIDNVDDVSVLSVDDRTAKDGTTWLRPSHSGLLIVTSRDVDQHHWGQVATVHQFDWLSDDDGARVLLDLAPRAGSDVDARLLSNRLGGLPLALHHAGTYLGSGFATERTFAKYLKAIEERFYPLMAPSLEEVHINPDHDRIAINSTWELSLDLLDGRGVGYARDFLGILSWFASSVPIPIDLLDYDIFARFCDHAGVDGVNRGLAALKSVGLIERRFRRTPTTEPDDDGIMDIVVHPLVAETTRHRLREDPARRAELTSAVVDIVDSATIGYEPDKPESWRVFETIYPHLCAILSLAAPQLHRTTLARLANVADRCALNIVWSGSYSAVLDLTESALLYTEELGTTHPAILSLRHRRAGALDSLGRHQEAEKEFHAILPLREQTLGADHPDTMDTLFQVAGSTADRGDLEDAELILRDLIRRQERVLGENCPASLYSRHLLAEVILRQGHHVDALDMLNDLLDAEVEVLGTNHVDTLAVRHHIALCIARLGDLDKARHLYDGILETRRKILGEGHPHTLNTRLEIARLTVASGDLTKAEQLYEAIYRETKAVMGATHRRTLAIEKELADIRSRTANA